MYKILAPAAGIGLMIATAPIAISNPAPVAPKPAAFAACAACHTTEPGKTSFGPNLARISGRKAASLPNYAYSPALKASGLVWTAENLDKWLTSPQKLVPGTKMPFSGITDPAKRKQVVNYLLTLR